MLQGESPLLRRPSARLIARPTPANDHFYNGLYTRYRYPVLTREHIPPFWMYDADPASNPFMMQRLGANAQDDRIIPEAEAPSGVVGVPPGGYELASPDLSKYKNDQICPLLRGR